MRPGYLGVYRRGRHRSRRIPAARPPRCASVEGRADCPGLGTKQDEFRLVVRAGAGVVLAVAFVAIAFMATTARGGAV
jgi:hypothetical protein